MHFQDKILSIYHINTVAFPFVLESSFGFLIMCPLCLQSDSGDELSPVSSDMLPDLGLGQRTSVCSTGSEETSASPVIRQLSGSKSRDGKDNDATEPRRYQMGTLCVCVSCR